MTFCEHCGEKISFLPFKCKYCGGVYCKKHRLPENHQCSFESKHIPVITSALKESKLKQSDSNKGTINVSKYIRRQERQEKKSLKQKRRSSSMKSQHRGIKAILLLIILFSGVAIVFRTLGIEEYVFLSLNAIIYQFTYHTFITSLFVYSINPFDYFFFFSIIFIFIIFYFAYSMGKIIESAFGTRFLVKLFLFSGLVSLIFYILLRLGILFYYPLDNLTHFDSVGLVWGGLFGLFTFIIYPAMNQRLTALVTIIPIRMSGKSFLLIIILFRLIPGLIYGLGGSFLYFLYYLPELGGILGSYLVFKYRMFMR
ncbi:MAG: AN1-type zinc finger domain-containing protein [Candidatus Lokiarchaeota archaeon]|nr:AN1-type zinc finger domain-containing protein [Candidatus Lokiarchaeota archaeon]